MKKLIKHVNHLLIGAATSSLVYISALMLSLDVPSLTIKNGLIVVSLGAIIGLYSAVFDSEKISFLTALICHFILTLSSVLFSLLFFNSSITIIQEIGFWVSFLMIYLIIWGGVSLYQRISIKKINRKLQDNYHKR
ncbi:DUF3021 domain-containing protein [Holzapfeliella sp. He02]|uniref:DUF3021 domain-containing protein n=1 Tax=Holzapfeliella saturejae TaxID=3082953 RepID=A0ABU8SF31_9LACO